MADDAEMTLIPSNTQPATGSAVAEPPKHDTTNIFGRFKKKLLFADETVVFFKVPAVALALTADCPLAAEMPKDFQGTWCTRDHCHGGEKPWPYPAALVVRNRCGS